MPCPVRTSFDVRLGSTEGGIRDGYFEPDGKTLNIACAPI